MIEKMVVCVSVCVCRGGNHEEAIYLSFNGMEQISWTTEAVCTAGLCSWE